MSNEESTQNPQESRLNQPSAIPIKAEPKIKNLAALARRLETDAEQVKNQLLSLSQLDLELKSAVEALKRAETDIAAFGVAAKEAAERRRQILSEPRAKMLKVLADAKQSLADLASRSNTIMIHCGSKPIADVVPILEISNAIKDFNERAAKLGPNFGEETKQLLANIEETVKAEDLAKESIEAAAKHAEKTRRNKKELEARISNLLEHPLVKSALMISGAEEYHGRLRKEAEAALNQAKHEASVASNERQGAQDVLKAAQARLQEIETNGKARLDKIEVVEKEKRAELEALGNKVKNLETQKKQLDADVKYMSEMVQKRKQLKDLAAAK